LTFALGTDVTTRGEGIVKKLEIGFLEKGLGRTDRIRRVSNDDIVGALVIGKKFKTVANVNGDSGVREKTGHVRQELLGYADNGLKARLVCGI
jgi:hypothetical protein